MRITIFSFALVVAGCMEAPRVATDRPLPPPEPRDTAQGVPVTTSGNCPKGACDIVEILDIHTSATSQDKGFDELRARAAADHADAVVGAEFEHGDDGGPSHLSGVVVRYAEPPPPHDDLGEIDVASDEANEDKGLKELLARAHEMGGDQVIDVTFEHGDDGQQGHLRGRVIRYTR
jgi:uncharacterized protein YbjQ (UPF0145 family)